MKNYIYELIITDIDGYKIKRFVGNDMDELIERSEQFIIKSGTPRSNMKIYTGKIQHVGYVAKVE